MKAASFVHMSHTRTHTQCDMYICMYVCIYIIIYIYNYIKIHIIKLSIRKTHVCRHIDVEVMVFRTTTTPRGRRACSLVKLSFGTSYRVWAALPLQRAWPLLHSPRFQIIPDVFHTVFFIVFFHSVYLSCAVCIPCVLSS